MTDLDVLQVVTSTHRRGAETFAVDLGAALTERVRSVTTVALADAPGPGRFDLPVLSAGFGVSGASGGSGGSGAGPRRSGRPGKGGVGPRVVMRLRSRVRRADVVVAHGSSTLLACALATPGTGTPFVYRLIGDPTYWVSSAGRRARVRLLLSRAAAIAVYHDAAAEALSRLHGIPRQRIHVIGKGVPVERHPVVTQDERREARERLGLGPDVSVVTYVGALSPEKDVALTVEATALVRDERNGGVHLVLAGDGPERGRLESLAASRGVPATFLGSTSDARQAMAAADVVILTSRTEGVPSVLLEAGLAGLPTVTTDVGDAASVVEDGSTGIVVRDRDAATVARALDEVLEGAPLMGPAARERCERCFAMGPVADQWADLLSRIAERRTP